MKNRTKLIAQSYTYNVVAENPRTGDFYVSESNIESKDTAYQLFDSLVNQHKYTAVRVDRTCVTVNASQLGDAVVHVSDRWLDKHYNSTVTIDKGVQGYHSFGV